MVYVLGNQNTDRKHIINFISCCVVVVCMKYYYGNIWLIHMRLHHDTTCRTASSSYSQWFRSNYTFKVIGCVFAVVCNKLSKLQKIAWLLVHVLCRIYDDDETFGWMVMVNSLKCYFGIDKNKKEQRFCRIFGRFFTWRDMVCNKI